MSGYSLVVFKYKDGHENVVNGFGGYYASVTNAHRAVEKFIAKYCLLPPNKK